MGLQQFERRLERLVEGVFAKAFRSGLEPVEVGRRMAREMDLRRQIGVRGVIAPNHFVITLSPQDQERFQSFADAFVRDLRDAARAHAKDEGYTFVGPVEVELETDSSLGPGRFSIVSELLEGPGGGPVGWLLMSDGTRVEVGDEPVAIGRLPECEVVLADANVSRRHAEVRRQDDGFFVVDLGSTNGTRVNGQGVRERRLADGDEISVGSTVLRFEAT
jgi:hypothetical protein